MVLTIETIKKIRFNSLYSPAGKEIFEIYFLEEKAQFEVVEKLLKIKAGKKNRKQIKGVLKNLVSKYTKAWEGLGYLEKQKKEISYKLDKKQNNKADYYYANLNPFFEKFEKTHKIEIPIETKKFIELCFEISEIRKDFIGLLKEQDLFIAFEMIVKMILYFIMRETPKFKDYEPDGYYKRKKFVAMVIPRIKEKTQSFLFNASKSDNKIRHEIMNELELIFKEYKTKEQELKKEIETENYDFEILVSEAGKENFLVKPDNTLISAWNFFKCNKEEFIYIFYLCDSDNSDILISLIKLFSDKLTQMLLIEIYKGDQAEINEELTKYRYDKRSKYIYNIIIKNQIEKFRKFIVWYFMKELPLPKVRQEVLKKLKDTNGKEFEKIKDDYIKRKVNILFNTYEKLNYFIEKLDNKKREKDYILKESKEEYYKRWHVFFKNIKCSDVISDLRKTIQ